MPSRLTGAFGSLLTPPKKRDAKVNSMGMIVISTQLTVDGVQDQQDKWFNQHGEHDWNAQQLDGDLTSAVRSLMERD